MSAQEIQISKLPDGFTLTELNKLLQGLAGRVGEARLEGRNATVQFSSTAQAEHAVKQLHGKMLRGGKKIQAALAPAASPSTAPTPSPAAPPFAPEKGGVPAPALKALRSIPESAGGPPAIAFGSDRRQSAPYHFVPVDTQTAVADEPIWHDLLEPNTRFTGELRCTLTALTPLLAANYQYEWQNANAAVKQSFEALVRSRSKPTNPVHKDKKFLEPLTLPGVDAMTPGGILIGGAALKGMQRQCIAALLAAPMERVQERHSSYRPNVQMSPKRDDYLATCVGIVVPGGRDGAIRVRLLDQLIHVLYVTSGAVPNVLRAMGIRNEEEVNTRLGRLRAATTEEEFNRHLDALTLRDPVPDCFAKPSRLEPGRGAASVGTRILLPYRYGLDGDGVFNRAFEAKNPGETHRVYHWVLVAPPKNRNTITVPADVVQGWRETLYHLRDDGHGHLLNHPNIKDEKKNAIAAVQTLIAEGCRPGDIFYLEQEKTGTKRVVTMGHHFRYRWRYRDTVHSSRLEALQRHGLNGAASCLRDVLCPLPKEMEPTPDGRPQMLSAARLLFGYVGTTKGDYDATQPTTFGVGVAIKEGKAEPSDFAQLAGRIAFNAAVEHPDDAAKPLADRFLNAQDACLVPMRPLGAPKPSAVEHYLTQDRLGHRIDSGIVCTFGDTADDLAAGQLRGRKFYLHQPPAAHDASLFELQPGKWAAQDVGRREEDADMLLSDQAGIGRFISKCGIRYRFTVRFTELRPWELGALLFSLAPSRRRVELLRNALPVEVREPLDRWLQKYPADGPAPLLAHKLGHGRPLGMGSVTVDVDAALRLRPDDTQEFRHEGLTAAQQDDAIRAFAQRMQELLGANLGRWVRGVLLPWLEVHRYAGRSASPYPRARARDGSNTIFNYHSELRVSHGGGRKQRAPRQRDRHGLRDID